MSNVKAYGRVAQFLADSARIEVLLYKRQGETITDPRELKQIFPPHGCVFAPKFADRFDHPLDALVEFYVSSRQSTREKGDIHLMDIDRDCRQVGYPLIPITQNILVDDQSILQPVLKECISGDYNHFYIQHRDYAYGPFKTQNNDIVPRIGTFVNRYRLTDQTYVFCEMPYYLQEPREIVGKVDCMTQAQLANFFKDQVRKLDIGVDIAEVKHALEKQTNEDLDQARIRRVIYSLDKLELTSQTLRELANHSTRFASLYQEALKNCKAELQKEHVQPLLDQKAALTREIEKLTSQVGKLREEESETSILVNAKRAEYELIAADKDRLIQDIRVHALVKETDEQYKAPLVTYEESVYNYPGSAFVDLQAFLQPLQESFQTSENGTSRLAQHIVYQLKDYKCFLSHRIEPILQVAQLSNNCKVVLQQVEPDWLKFERLYHNGLKQIWSSAHQHKTMLHFLVLQDLNLASIECYGRPVLDLLSGIRQTLPGEKTAWPDNLWIFGIPVQHFQEDEFGLPPIKATFRDWGYLPVVEPLKVNRKVTSQQVLSLTHLFSHHAIVPSFINDYFPA